MSLLQATMPTLLILRAWTSGEQFGAPECLRHFEWRSRTWRSAAAAGAGPVFEDVKSLAARPA
jgi:hypothetical protein